MVTFSKYCKIKDNYCICYFGSSKEYLVQLKALRPIIQRTYPEMIIYIGHLKTDSHLLENESNLLCDVDLKSKRDQFGHIYELKYNNTNDHPVEIFMKDCGINDYYIGVNQQKNHTKICTLITKGVYPVKSLNDNQIQILKKKFSDEGYDVQIDGSLKNEGIFVGVESPLLFQAALSGFKTVLVPTSIGDNLYKKMFENAEILMI